MHAQDRRNDWLFTIPYVHVERLRRRNLHASIYVLTPDFPIVMTREISRRSLAIIVYQYYIGKGFQAVIELHLIGYDVKYIYIYIFCIS